MKKFVGALALALILTIPTAIASVKCGGCEANRKCCFNGDYCPCQYVIPASQEATAVVQSELEGVLQRLKALNAKDPNPMVEAAIEKLSSAAADLVVANNGCTATGQTPANKTPKR